jgi:hypothetical protein
VCYSYQHLDTEPHAKDGATEANQDTFPVGKSVPIPPINPPKPIVPETPNKQDVRPDPAADTRQANVEKPNEPLLVRVIEDDELSSFEQKTVLFGRWGVGVAILSLLAASVAGFFIFQQFEEMAAQTDLASRVAKQARIDAKDSSTVAAKQLAILQNQLTQQRRSMEIDQRPWLKFELGGERPKDADPNNGKSRLLTTTAGQPIKIEVRVTNIGKTTAEKILGTLTVQYVPKGGKPILPKKANRLLFTEGTKKGDLPGTAWGEATLYPNEVSQNSFSRSRWGKNGTVEDDPITQTEKTELDRGNAYVLLLGEVWYSDVFGVRHWTKFCEISSQLDLAIAKTCLAFGAVDPNQPKADGQSQKAN